MLSVLDSLTGCTSDLFVKTVQVDALPDSSFSLPNAACEGDVINVNYTGVMLAGQVYNWNFSSAGILSGSGSGPYNITFSTSGVYDVSLLVDLNGCYSDDTNSIIITDSPIANAGSDVVVCSGETNQIGFTGIPGLTYT